MFKGGNDAASFVSFGSQTTHVGFGALSIQNTSRSVRRLLHGRRLTSNPFLNEVLRRIGPIHSNYAGSHYSDLHAGSEDCPASFCYLTNFDFDVYDSRKIVQVSSSTGAADFKSSFDVGAPVEDVLVSKASDVVEQQPDVEMGNA